MKKLLLIAALLLAGFTQAQEVSPYYPAKYTGKTGFHFTSQLTYFDLNFISNNISEFLLNRLSMVVEKTDDSKLLFDGGRYTVNYVDRLSQSGLKKLAVVYEVSKVNDVYTINSVTINGSDERVTDFFIEFWQTAMNFEEPKGNSNVSVLTGQDVVKYYFNKGKPYVAVTNGTFKTVEEFKNHFQKLKASH